MGWGRVGSDGVSLGGVRLVRLWVRWLNPYGRVDAIIRKIQVGR